MALTPKQTHTTTNSPQKRTMKKANAISIQLRTSLSLFTASKLMQTNFKIQWSRQL